MRMYGSTNAGHRVRQLAPSLLHLASPLAQWQSCRRAQPAGDCAIRGRCSRFEVDSDRAEAVLLAGKMEGASERIPRTARRLHRREARPPIQPRPLQDDSPMRGPCVFTVLAFLALGPAAAGLPAAPPADGAVAQQPAEKTILTNQLEREIGRGRVASHVRTSSAFLDLRDLVDPGVFSRPSTICPPPRAASALNGSRRRR